MTGNYILENRPSHFHRIDFVLTAERYLGIATLIVGLPLSYYFYTLSAYPASATVFAFTLGLSGYVLTATYNRHIQITEYAERTLTMLQERWDILRTDPFLLSCLTSGGPLHLLSKADRIRLRLYRESFLGVQALIIHYIRRGYYRHTAEFAIVYEKMIREIFEYPYFIEIWQSDVGCGQGRLRDHFATDLVRVVDCIIEDIMYDREHTSIERSA